MLLAASCLTPHSSAQAGAQTPVPDSLVLVVRLLSDDRVRPTTGVVVSSDGLILLPLDFVAAEGGEIYVLDGGTDPSQHGRPVSVLRSRKIEGVVLARAEGLSRPPMVFASKRPQDDSVVQLWAYSDSTSMQSGRLFTRKYARVRLHQDYDTLALSRGFPLPNVSGAVTDACNHLLGLSLARGTSTAASTGSTTYLWVNRLHETLLRLGVEPQTGDCEDDLPWPDPVPGQAPEAEQAAETAGIAPTKKPEATSEGEEESNGSAKRDAANATAEKKQPPRPDGPAGDAIKPPKPVANKAVPARRAKSAPSAELVRSAQEALQRLDLYAGPIDGKLSDDTRSSLEAFHRNSELPPDSGLDAMTLVLMAHELELRERAEREANLQDRVRSLEQQNQELAAALAAQPRTALERLIALGPELWILALLLLVAVFVASRRTAPRRERPRGAIDTSHTEARITTPFLIVGQLPGGTDIRDQVNARDGRVDAVIGRSNASILIPDDSVGRQHARLEGNADDLWLIDLGSLNGTWVNDERCDRGRPRAVRAGDEIVVGGVHLRIEACPEQEPGQ
jgi:peptidoglycan hydrolase-like protein with peptidoglycan-binding domain